ncbi:hypothetical protein [Dysgonomonas mossii]|uniref:hypothetical protein n=1 Tax=Dysgonomonas mossii TaxID=163665 RepID=UPI00399368F5
MKKTDITMPRVLGSKDGLFAMAKIAMLLVDLINNRAIDKDFPLYWDREKEELKGCDLQSLLDAIKKDIPEVDITKLKKDGTITGIDFTTEIVSSLIINDGSIMLNDTLITKIIAFFYKHIYDTKKAYIDNKLKASLISIYDEGKTKENFRKSINELLLRSNVEYYLTKEGDFIIFPLKERKTPSNTEVIKTIHSAFELNVPIPKENIKQKIQEIFNSFYIDREVTQDTVLSYFKASPSGYKKPATFRLKEKLFLL